MCADEKTKVELPFWLAKVMTEDCGAEVDLPKHYNRIMRNEINAGPVSIKFREYSFYYFELGYKLAALDTERGGKDLLDSLKTAFSGDRYRNLSVRALSNWGEDLADFTQSLTNAELAIFQLGVNATKDIMRWRIGNSATLQRSSILGKRRSYSGRDNEK
jgi:hypothetical protein